MVLALRHGLLPKTLHVDAPSAKADWSPGTVSLLTEARPWPRENRPRRAGVSSFGSSGSKVHLILEEAPEPAAAEPPSPGTPVPWPLSAKTPEALHAQAHRLRAHLSAHPELTPTDVARALAARSAFDHRAVLHGTTMQDLIAGLERLEHGQLAPNLPPEVDESPIAAAARTFVEGKDVDWSPFLPAADGAPVELPSYAFQRKRYWIPA
jgi:acyl transferase domain-containing protein